VFSLVDSSSEKRRDSREKWPRNRSYEAISHGCAIEEGGKKSLGFFSTHSRGLFTSLGSFGSWIPVKKSLFSVRIFVLFEVKIQFVLLKKNRAS
jgi:hypothetical protein